MSTYHLPHVHLNFETPGNVPEDMLGRHFPTGRLTFEDAVEWVFAHGAAQPARDDWREVLDASRDLHVEHRTWDVAPPLD